MHLIAMYLGGVCTVVAHLFWKAQSRKTKGASITDYFQIYTIMGYILFLMSIGLSVYGLREVRLIEMVIITPLTQIFVIGLSAILFKEKISKHQFLFMGIIIIGVAIFNLDF